MSDLCFVSCTQGVKEDTALFASLRALGVRDFHFFEHNRRGLPACYNEWLDRLAGQDVLLVLAHDDVQLGDVFFRDKLHQVRKHFNITGVVGSAVFDFHQPTQHYRWTLWPPDQLSGAVEHALGGDLTRWFVFGPTPRRCVILDGVLLAIDMRTIGDVRFDPQFSFHLYDLDFCITAGLAGLTLGTAGIHVRHLAKPDYAGEAYGQALQEFRVKWASTFARPQGRITEPK